MTLVSSGRRIRFQSIGLSAKIAALKVKGAGGDTLHNPSGLIQYSKIDYHMVGISLET